MTYKVIIQLILVVDLVGIGKIILEFAYTGYFGVLPTSQNRWMWDRRCIYILTLLRHAVIIGIGTALQNLM